MKKIFVFVFSFFLFMEISSLLAAGEMAKGFNLTEIGTNYYDASVNPSRKTSAQKVVDELHKLGITQINLNPRAVMKDPRGVEVIPMTKGGRERSEERIRYMRFIKYIKSKGMKVGIRPIFFVVDAAGHTPVTETLPDGTVKSWWHGNIQPKDPYKWFESFRNYLDIYLAIAKYGKVDEFTIGAELYSMTVGIEDQWKEHPHGFGPQWLELLQHSRGKLPEHCKIMYDINFTDASIVVENTERHGGEFARWKYRLVDLQDENDPHWTSLRDFWLNLDAVGIDMYRSLATKKQEVPEDYDELVSVLKRTSDRYAAQLDTGLFEISMAMETEKPVILKEIGYRSVKNAFINPFEYAGAENEELNIEHQAASYEAIFESFFTPGWTWFSGAIFWDASADLKLHGPQDQGFSPLGKTKTEEVISSY